MEKQEETLKRWRLLLGGQQADGTGVSLNEQEKQIDEALSALYDFEQRGKFEYGPNQKGGSGASQPGVARWRRSCCRTWPALMLTRRSPLCYCRSRVGKRPTSCWPAQCERATRLPKWSRPAPC